MNKISVFIFLLFINISCSNNNEQKENETNSQQQEIQSNKKNNNEIQLKTKEYLSSFELSDFFENNEILSQLTDSLYNKMSLKQRASQMIVSGFSEKKQTFHKIKKLVKENLIGGVLIVGSYKKDELIKKIKEINKISKNNLLFLLDSEPALLNKRITDLKEKFYTNANFYNIKTQSYDIANILSEIGIQYNLAPVSDLNINKAIINNRSFGSNVNDVIQKTNIFINEQQYNGIVATAKHFPGHGYAKGDSHLKTVNIDKLNKEFKVFKANINNKVLSVMIGHIIVKSGKYNTNNIPASISKKIITNLLRNELKFKGIIISDALDMGALNNFKNIALKSAMAGTDLLLIPKNEEKISKQIVDVLKNKKSIYHNQFVNSIKRIIRLKICLNLFNSSVLTL